MSFCLHCGAKLSPSARFCTTCGKSKPESTGGAQWTPEEAKDRARKEAQEKRLEQIKTQQDLEAQRSKNISLYRDAPQCTKCGMRLNATTRFCTGCGTPRKTLEELGLEGAQKPTTPTIPTPTVTPTPAPKLPDPVAPKVDDRAELEKKRLAEQQKKEREDKEKKEREEKDRREREDKERREREEKERKEREDRQKQQMDLGKKEKKDKEEKDKRDKEDRERREKEDRERREKERREREERERKEKEKPPPPDEPHPEEEEEEEEDVELDAAAKEQILKGLTPPNAAEIKARAGSSADQRREERLADLYGKARFRSLGRILAIGNKAGGDAKDSEAKALVASLQPDIQLQPLRSILATLNSKISKEEWVEEFLQAEALTSISNALEKIYSTIGSDELLAGNKSKNGQLSPNAQLLETLLECLEVLITDESTLEPMSTTPKLLSRILACLNVIHSSIHNQVYNIASMLCLAGEAGKPVLDALESVKTKTRYGVLAADLEMVLANNSALELDLKLNSVTLVNSLLDAEPSLKARIALRGVFENSGIKKKVEALSGWVESTRDKQDLHDPDKLDELDSHTDHYETAANTDERESNLNDLDLHDPEAVFQVLMENTEADGYSSILLSILQLLLTIPARKDLAQSVWNNVQFMVNSATGRVNEKSGDDDDDQEQRFMGVDELRKLLLQKEELDSQTIGSYVGSLEEQNSKLKQENRELRASLDAKGIAPVPMDGPPMEAPPMDGGPPPPMDDGAPPPPMDDGGPPPPPPLLDGPPGTPLVIDDGPRLPPRPKMNPKKKMKKFHWAVVTPKEIDGDTFWMKVLKENVENEFKIDFNDLEDNFCAKVVEKKEDAKEEKGLKGPRKVERVNLIEPKRAYNVDIGLARFRMSHMAIRDAILSMDETLLNQDRLAPLIKLMPTNEELEVIRTFAKTDDPTKLTSAGQFFHALSDIKGFPDLTTRLELFLFKQQYQSLVDGIDVKLDLVKKVADTCRNSAHLKKIFTLILLIGNYLNGGTKQGEAYGFKLSALTQLKATKTVDNKMTMIHYLADYVNKNCPEVRKFVEDLKDIKEVADLEETAMEQDIGRIRTMLSHSKKALQMAMDDPSVDDSFQRVMITFDAQANIKFGQLQKKFEAAKASTETLGAYFGEKKGTLKWEELFQRFHTFCDTYEKAERQLEKIKKEEEKKKKMDEMKAERDTRREEKKKGQEEEEEGASGKKGKKGKKDKKGGVKMDKDGISLGKIKRRKKGGFVKRIKKSAKSAYDRVLRSGADDEEEDEDTSKKAKKGKKAPSSSGPCDNFTVNVDDADTCGNCGLAMTQHNSAALDKFLKGTLDIEVAEVEKTARMEVKDMRLSAEEERQIKSATNAFGNRLRKVAPRGEDGGSARTRGRIKVTLRKSNLADIGLLPPSASFSSAARLRATTQDLSLPTSASFSGAASFGFQPLRKIGDEAGIRAPGGPADFKSTLKPTLNTRPAGATTAAGGPDQKSFLGVLKKPHEAPSPNKTPPTPEKEKEKPTTPATPIIVNPPTNFEVLPNQPSTPSPVPSPSTTPTQNLHQRSRSATEFSTSPLPSPASLGGEPIVETIAEESGGQDEETKRKIEEEEKRKESELRRIALEQKKAAAQARLEALQKAKEKALIQREEAKKKEEEAKKQRSEAERRVSMMHTGKADPRKAAAKRGSIMPVQTKRFCTVCGTRLPAGGARFCTGCGTRVT